MKKYLIKENGKHYTVEGGQLVEVNFDYGIVGLCVDYQNKTFERLGNAVGKTAGTDFNSFVMYGGRRRCNVADNGEILAFYGDDDFAEDGSNGQVMVYQPKFWYKVEPLVLEENTDSGIGYHVRKANYFVCGRKVDGFKLHPAFYDESGNPIDYILMSAYEAALYDTSEGAWAQDNRAYSSQVVDTANDLIGSISGCQPISNISKPNFELLAQNRGTGWHVENIKVASANQLLMIIELGAMNTQTGIANGVVSTTDNAKYNCSSYTGSTSSLGNGTGQATSTTDYTGTEQTTNGKTAVTYRGVENPWGNIWKHIQGINTWGDGTMCGGQPYVCEDFSYNESKHEDNYKPVGFTLPNASGYINAMGYGSEEYDWLLMPSEVGGNSNLPVGDYTWVTTDLNGYRIALLGGRWSFGANAGGFYWYYHYGAGSRDVGGRLLYVPNGKTLQSSDYLAEDFIENGFDTLPTSDLLTDLTDPAVLMWDSDSTSTDLLHASVTANPYPQELSAVADMSDVTITGISNISAVFSGMVGIKYSYDGEAYTDEQSLADFLETDPAELYAGLEEDRLVHIKLILHEAATLTEFKITYSHIAATNEE